MDKFKEAEKIPANGKVFRDALHGNIFIPNKFIAIIDTPEFQRLRRIKQLSVANMVFPGADHTRFSHSIGAFYIVQLLINHFEKLVKELVFNDSIVFSEEDKDLARLSALLHDIGHGPFSHAFEYLYPKKSHEDWTISIINHKEGFIHQSIVENFGKDYPKKVSDLLLNQREAINDESNKNIKKIDIFSIISSLISSQLDADRMDYLLRDSFYTGVNLGSIDLQRLISSFQLTVSKDNFIICVLEKYIQDIEAYLLSRYQMQKTVYYHNFKIQMEQIIIQIFDRAKEVYKTDNLNFLPASVKSLLAEKEISVNDYLSLDDSVFNYCFMEWSTSSDKILSSLCEGILHRKKATKLPLIDEKNPALEEFKIKLVELLNSSEYKTTVNGLKKEPFWIESNKSYSAYKPKKENIWIQKPSGVIEDITKVSKIIISKGAETVWENSERVVFINYNILNTLQIRDSESVISSIKELVKQYSPRNLIEIEKKYHFSDELVREKVLKLRERIENELKYSYKEEQAIKQVDTYYDTDDELLKLSNRTLRIRNKSGNLEITIKKPVRNQVDTGQSERFEFQESVVRDDLNDSKGFIFNHLEDISDISVLHKVLTIENDREPVTLINGKVRLEMVFDTVVYKKDDISVKDYQLEIELKSDYSHRINLKLLTDYLERNVIELKPLNTSKYQRGLEKIQNAGKR